MTSWRTKEGKYLLVSDMTHSHVINTIKLIARRKDTLYSKINLNGVANILESEINSKRYLSYLIEQAQDLADDLQGDSVHIGHFG
jgi:hypothetical protein